VRYYFHLKHGQELIRDEEGDELPDDERAKSAAIKAARELLAETIRQGRDLELDAFVIEDEHGHNTFLPLAEALPKRLRG
jgi:hypothetical protein